MALDKWIADGLLVEVHEPTRASSPLVVVPKPNGGIRVCIDLREVNKGLVLDHFSLPNYKELFPCLQGMKYFSKLDNLWGYLQWRVSEESQDLLCISTPWGYYKFRFLPFGVTTGPGLYQQMMAHQVLQQFHLRRNTVVFVDDTTQGGRDEHEYLTILTDLLQTLVQYRVKLKASKCTFGFSKCLFVGHEFSEHGVCLTEERKEAICSMSTPKTLKELRGFLGAVGYFRDFIPHLSQLLAPLTSLTKGEGGEASRRQEFKGKITPEMEAVIVKVKQAVRDAQLLYFLQDEGEIILYTDASMEGIGGYLAQIQQGVEKPIWFLSHKFTDTERRWSTIEQECFGIVFCILKLTHLLLGRMFLVATDHLNLIYLERSEVPKLVRWRLRLQEFSFTVRHIAGVENVVADGLSRLLVHQQMAISGVEEWGPHAVQSVHNGLVGHFGIGKTVQRVEEWCEDVRTVWPSYKEDIAKFIKSCAVCQKLKFSPSSESEGGHHLHSTRPFVSISADTIGPFPVDDDGMAYVVVVMCNFSKYVELLAAPTTEAKFVVKALVDWCCVFGIPEELRTDGGSQYTADIIKQLTSSFGIKLCTIVPYHPQANGLVERKNGEVKKHIKALVMEEKGLKVWSRRLNLVKMIIVNTTDSSTGVRASQLVFGSGRDVLGTLVTRVMGKTQSATKQLSLLSVVEELDRSLTALIGASQKHLEAQAKKMDSKQAELQKGKSVVFEVGDYVLMSYPERPPHGLAPRYRGPMVVVEKPHKDICVLGDLVTQKNVRCHVDRLRKFIVADGVLPHELMSWAMVDHNEYVVEAVVDHGYDGDTKQRRQLKLLIQWTGYSKEESTWEWYKDVRDVGVVKEYVKQHKL